MARAKPAAKAKAKSKTKATKAKATKAKAKPKPKLKLSKTAFGALEKNWPKQQLTISHLNGDDDFVPHGLRPYAAYRDLGLAKATSGKVQVHVVRIKDGVNPAHIHQQRHYHNVNFQMVYIMKGWLMAEFEGHGQHMMRAGSCWLQPAKIVHHVVSQSNDLELMEIIMPAEFETVDV